jgi:hypothetical protein
MLYMKLTRDYIVIYVICYMYRCTIQVYRLHAATVMVFKRAMRYVMMLYVQMICDHRYASYDIYVYV